MLFHTPRVFISFLDMILLKIQRLYHKTAYFVTFWKKEDFFDTPRRWFFILVFFSWRKLFLSSLPFFFELIAIFFEQLFHSWNFHAILETIVHFLKPFFFCCIQLKVIVVFFRAVSKKTGLKTKNSIVQKKKFVFLLCLIGWPLVFAFSWKMVCFFWRGYFFF